ncbi:MAG: endonuclease/exonuclease/phosphatase family protein [Proteobacteria bacterium]|nr:endonuclease/exonuclease/phosphatase family protein [Pseudomonadota bacterium]
MVPESLTDLIAPASAKDRADVFRDICAELPDRAGPSGAALRWIEQDTGQTNNDPASALRIAFWNAERGGTPEHAAMLLSQTGADIVLLCELDMGVARTGQLHTTRETAQHLGANYLYAVEFIELENAEAHSLGFHGNAILSRNSMLDPILIRFPEDRDWLTGTNRDRRLGSRIALAARIVLDGHSVVVATTHLESHTGPDQRAHQMELLLNELESYADGQPILIGGDFNTRTATKDAMRNTAARQALKCKDPKVFTQPQAREPLFEIAARAGYTWLSCNQPLPTERGSAEVPARPLFRLDWFFARGLVCETSRNIPAETPCGASLSDHDVITTDIRLSGLHKITR